MRKERERMDMSTKKSVFDSIKEASSEKMPESKVCELTDKVIDLFAEYNLEYSQAHKILDCVGITLGARSRLMKP